MLFADILHKRKYDTSKSENIKRWFQIGEATFFVIKRWKSAEAGFITASMEDESLVFTATGNVGCLGGMIVLENPLDLNTIKSVDQDSVFKVRASESQYVFDESTVFSDNMRYILRKDGDDAWVLLYNPMHTASFRSYYVDVMSRAQPSHVVFGATRLENDAHVSLQRLFRNYCGATHVRRPSWEEGESEYAYGDPSCNMFYNAKQCRESSLFTESMTSQDPERVARNEMIVEKLGAGNPPNCLCMGRPYNYATTYIGEDSFLHEFQDLHTCNPQMQNTVCNVINKAKTINMTDSTMAASCDGFSAADVGNKDEEDADLDFDPLPDPDADRPSAAVSRSIEDEDAPAGSGGERRTRPEGDSAPPRSESTTSGRSRQDDATTPSSSSSSGTDERSASSPSTRREESSSGSGPRTTREERRRRMEELRRRRRRNASSSTNRDESTEDGSEKDAKGTSRMSKLEKNKSLVGGVFVLFLVVASLAMLLTRKGKKKLPPRQGGRPLPPFGWNGQVGVGQPPPFQYPGMGAPGQNLYARP